MAYEYTSDPPIKVVVDGDHIPVINEGVTSRARINGVMDINRLTEVYFPAEWGGEDYVSKIKALDTDGESVWEPVDIRFRDPESGNYFTRHRGFIVGHGPGSKGTLERRLRIADPSLLLESITFSESYGNNATVSDVLEDIISTFDSHQDIFDSTTSAQIDTLLNESLQENQEQGSLSTFFDSAFGSPLNPIESIEGRVDDIVDISNAATAEKQFKSNKHTLKDAIQYVSKKVNGNFFFAGAGPNQSEIALVYDENRELNFYAQNADGSNAFTAPKVIKNNALFEIQPVNTVTVNGKTHKGPVDKIGDVITQSGGEYPVATATSPKLKRLAGQEYQKPTEPKDAFNEREAEKEAVEELISQIEGGGSGEIVTTLLPTIKPHDNIHTKPSCGGNMDIDLPTIKYTVNEVTHKTGFDVEKEAFYQKTHLRVNTSISEEEIEVTSSTESI